MAIVRMTLEEALKSPKSRLTPEQQLRLDAMTDAEITAAALSDPDNPPITDAEAATARPLGRPPLPAGERRVQVTMRWAPETVSALRGTGKLWNNFAEEAVRRALRAAGEMIRITGAQKEAVRYRRTAQPGAGEEPPARGRKQRKVASKKTAKSTPVQRRKAARKAARGAAGRKRKRA